MNIEGVTTGLIIRSDANVSGPDKNHYYLGIYPSQSLWKPYRTTTLIWSAFSGHFSKSVF